MAEFVEQSIHLETLSLLGNFLEEVEDLRFCESILLSKSLKYLKLPTIQFPSKTYLTPIKIETGKYHLNLISLSASDIDLNQSIALIFISRIITNSQKLKILELNSCKLSDSILKVLNNQKAVRNLREIALSNTEYDNNILLEEDILKILSGLEISETEDIELTCVKCYLSNSLFAQIPNNLKFSYMNLSLNDLRNISMKDIQFISASNLRELHLYDSNLDSNHLAMITQSSCEFKNLVRLNLSKNRFSGEEVINFMKNLSNFNGLVELYMYECSIEINYFLRIASVIHKTKQLQIFNSLCLPCNEMKLKSSELQIQLNSKSFNLGLIKELMDEYHDIMTFQSYICREPVTLSLECKLELLKKCGIQLRSIDIDDYLWRVEKEKQFLSMLKHQTKLNEITIKISHCSNFVANRKFITNIKAMLSHFAELKTITCIKFNRIVQRFHEKMLKEKISSSNQDYQSLLKSVMEEKISKDHLAFSKDAGKSILDIINSNRNLQYLSIENNYFPYSLVKNIIYTIGEKCQKLTALRFSFIDIEKYEREQLSTNFKTEMEEQRNCKILSKNKLEEFYFHEKDLGSSIGLSLFDDMQQNSYNLKRLSLPNCGNTSNIENVVCDIIKSNKNLQSLNFNNNKFTSKIGKLIFDELQRNCSSLTAIDFSNCSLDFTIAKGISQTIERNQQLNTICVSNNKLTPEVGIALCKSIMKNCSNIVVLDLSDCDFDETITDVLGKAIGANSHLTQLFIEKNKLGSKVSKSIFENIKENCSKLNILNTSYCNIDESIDKSIKEAIENNPYLTELYLQGNKFGSKVGISILKAARNKLSRLNILNLSNCQINVQIKNDLWKTIRSNPNLQQIYLNENSFGSDIINSITDVIKDKNQMTLTVLALSDCKINEEVQKKIAYALRFMPKLEKLLLNLNNLGSVVGPTIFETIKNHFTSLITINFSNCRFDQSTGALLGEAIGKNVNLREIYLRNNPLGSIVGSSIFKNIKNNCQNLNIIDFFNCKFDGDTQCIGDAIARNVYLQELNLGENNLGVEIRKYILHTIKAAGIYLSTLNLSSSIENVRSDDDNLPKNFWSNISLSVDSSPSCINKKTLKCTYKPTRPYIEKSHSSEPQPEIQQTKPLDLENIAKFTEAGNSLNLYCNCLQNAIPIHKSTSQANFDTEYSFPKFENDLHENCLRKSILDNYIRRSKVVWQHQSFQIYIWLKTNDEYINLECGLRIYLRKCILHKDLLLKINISEEKISFEGKIDNDDCIGWLTVPVQNYPLDFVQKNNDYAISKQFMRIEISWKTISKDFPLGIVERKNATLFICIQAQRICHDDICCLVTIRDNSTELNNLKNLVYLKEIEMKNCVEDSLHLYINSHHEMKVININLLSRGYIFGEHFFVNRKDIHINLTSNNKNILKDQFPLMERLESENCRFSIKYYIGKKLTLKIHNAKLVLTENGLDKPTVLSIQSKCSYEIDKSSGTIRFQNFVDCRPTGLCFFQPVDLYIKPLLVYKNGAEISTNNVSKNAIFHKASGFACLKITGFSDHGLLENWEKDKMLYIHYFISIQNMNRGSRLNIYYSLNEPLGVNHTKVVIRVFIKFSAITHLVIFLFKQANKLTFSTFVTAPFKGETASITLPLDMSMENLQSDIQFQVKPDIRNYNGLFEEFISYKEAIAENLTQQQLDENFQKFFCKFERNVFLSSAMQHCEITSQHDIRRGLSDGNIYDTTSRNQVVVIIIDDGNGARSENDWINLKIIFANLKHEIVLWRNIDRDECERKIRSLKTNLSTSNENEMNVQSLIFFILADGNNNLFFLSNNSTFEFNEFINYVDSDFHQFQGKPKLFFFQVHNQQNSERDQSFVDQRVAIKPIPCDDHVACPRNVTNRYVSHAARDIFSVLCTLKDSPSPANNYGSKFIRSFVLAMEFIAFTAVPHLVYYYFPLALVSNQLGLSTTGSLYGSPLPYTPALGPALQIYLAFY
ncbi:DgyrCDS14372 [Dimorphilus gyrociliatus]|uniref:DgyrCDS14372 n=1 Tax=Dimorphilus gyrociliatus TaxID=2664684 RepID=A0A7I8WDD5_9ANNE|nr:DgyrCDS14372 [Dimorphilus gyrociliatus]